MMENTRIYEKVKMVPESAKRPILAGRMKGMTDINPMWRIKVLTELFGPCGVGWYYKVTRQWIDRNENEAAAFVNIELFVRIDGEWSFPIFGTGGSKFVAKEKSGLYVSDECYKMATTDAISVACKQLGIGADVYWDKDSTKYTVMESDKEDVTSNKACNTHDNIPVKKASDASKKALQEICKKNGVNLESWLIRQQRTLETVTADEVGMMLKAMQERYGE